jgi:hypothetical protein
MLGAVAFLGGVPRDHTFCLLRRRKTLRKAGAAAGHMWRFVGEMKVGDLVVTPLLCAT